MTSLKTSIKTITYLSDTGCLEIQGASLQTCIHVFLFAIPAELTKNCILVVKYQIMQSFLQQHCILTIQDILNMILLIRLKNI